MLPVKSLLITFVLVTLVTFAQSKWVQVWSDEFNGNSINLNNWRFEEGILSFLNELQTFKTFFFNFFMSI